MARRNKKALLEAKNKKQEKQFFKIAGIVTGVLVIIMFIIYMT